MSVYYCWQAKVQAQPCPKGLKAVTEISFPEADFLSLPVSYPPGPPGIVREPLRVSGWGVDNDRLVYGMTFTISARSGLPQTTELVHLNLPENSNTGCLGKVWGLQKFEKLKQRMRWILFKTIKLRVRFECPLILSPAASSLHISLLIWVNP